jgi:hypothetical protein
MQIGISNFEQKRVKNLVNCQRLLCTETWRHSKLARRSCKIRREKHPRAFVKVVEGSEIYNFPIHHLVHFSCKNLSFYRSKRASPNNSRKTATSRRAESVGAAPARAQAALASGPPAHAPRLAERPEARSPKPHTSRGRLEVFPLLTPRGRTSTGRTAGPFLSACPSLLPAPPRALPVAGPPSYAQRN